MNCCIWLGLLLDLMLIREVSTTELSGAGISHSKSCDGKLDDYSSFPPLAATMSQCTIGPNHLPAEAAVHPIIFEFHENHGRNVQLGEGRRAAKRTASYNQGVVISSKPLPRDQLFQVILTGTGWLVFWVLPIWLYSSFIMHGMSQHFVLFVISLSHPVSQLL